MAAAKAIDVAPRTNTGFDNVSDAAGASSSRNRPDNRLRTDLNQNSYFESDRVIKCGYVEKRTKTKNWKTVYLVLRPNTLSMYKNNRETKLRHQVHLSDLSAVAYLKDPKHKRDHVFGLFSPSRNYHFQALSQQDAQEWVETIRRETRIEEEDELFLSSPLGRSASPMGLMPTGKSGPPHALDGHDAGRVLSSSPETYGPPESGFVMDADSRRRSYFLDSSGMSGNELPSHSDLSDNETPRPPGLLMDNSAEGLSSVSVELTARLATTNLSGSQTSISNNLGSSGLGAPGERHPDRVIWQGRLWQLRSRGVRPWREMWGVLRPRNLILYKDQDEYTAQLILGLSAVVDVVDTDSVKNKDNCVQIITEEKSYRFCFRDEEALVQFIGAFKSLLAKRRGLEARAATSSL
ncbi:Pleckstrin-domain containing protein [Metarhizium album ARSEF 1941]|uniref:Pleckstrin-domain containing protein n=1 Tax=Metarhizium album (strain ARSEF 1941) TaxID=1081103 RepID=A0A0B2WX82_METAS|nr:Pleckstrin-domain containing protein [Metarhizium album ARSEF 1941]KHO00842.1 Pleckstrin-domain containing protein [Metarhizium album ARSEF 1941]